MFAGGPAYVAAIYVAVVTSRRISEVLLLLRGEDFFCWVDQTTNWPKSGGATCPRIRGGFGRPRLQWAVHPEDLRRKGPAMSPLSGKPDPCERVPSPCHFQ